MPVGGPSGPAAGGARRATQPFRAVHLGRIVRRDSDADLARRPVDRDQLALAQGRGGRAGDDGRQAEAPGQDRRVAGRPVLGPVTSASTCSGVSVTVSAGARSSATRTNGVSALGHAGHRLTEQACDASDRGRRRGHVRAPPCSRPGRGASPGIRRSPGRRPTPPARPSAVADRMASSSDGSRAIMAVASSTSAAPGIAVAAARRSRSSAVMESAATAASASASASVTAGRSAGSRGGAPISATGPATRPGTDADALEWLPRRRCRRRLVHGRHRIVRPDRRGPRRPRSQRPPAPRPRPRPRPRGRRCRRSSRPAPGRAGCSARRPASPSPLRIVIFTGCSATALTNRAAGRAWRPTREPTMTVALRHDILRRRTAVRVRS